MQNTCEVVGCERSAESENTRCALHSRMYYGEYFSKGSLRVGTGGGKRRPKIEGEGYYGANSFAPTRM